MPPTPGFHPGAFPGMFKSALCMCVPLGHFRISQNIQSPQMETLFPCLSPFLSSLGWGLGHCRALFRGCRKHFKAQQSLGGLAKPPAGQEGGLNSTSHPLGLGTSLDSKESTKKKNSSLVSVTSLGGSKPPWDIIEFNNLLIIY